MRVWMSDWQLQCCGQPFEVGSRVAWTLTTPDLDWLRTTLGDTSHVDAYEDHHLDGPEDVNPTHGIVTAINAVSFDRVLRDDGASYPVAGSAKLTPVSSADGRNVEPGGGYLVDLAID